MSHFCGLLSFKAIDPSREFTVPSYIFYPTSIAEQMIKVGPYILSVAEKAVVSEGKFPLVVISHGTGGTPLVYRSLAMHLARNGYIVVALEHPFNNRDDNTHEGTIENLVNRPRHLNLVIDLLCADPFWSKHLRTSSVTVIGHSMGGYTAVAAAGGIPHTKHQIAYDPHCKITSSQEISVRKNKKINSLVLLAPALGWFASEGALAQVNLPVLMLSAEKDFITPLFHAEILLKGVKSPQKIIHEVIPNAGHFSFLTPFPEMMKKMGFAPALDPEGFDREEFHRYLNGRVLDFLESQILE